MITAQADLKGIKKTLIKKRNEIGGLEVDGWTVTN